jgi:ribosomal protein S4
MNTIQIEEIVVGSGITPNVFRRLLKQGAILVNDVKITEPIVQISSRPIKVQCGKNKIIIV